MAEGINVVIYSRVSTQEQATEGTSLDYQDDQLRSYCQFQKWRIVQSYADRGYSGKDVNRPGLHELFSDAKLGLFEKVIVFKLDRLARNLRFLLEIEEKLQEHLVSLVSMKESLDTSIPIGKTVFQVLGLVSEWERESIIERTRSGRIQRYKEGCWAGGKPAYGYKYNRETKKLVINEPEAIIVAKIFEKYTTGKSMVYISNMLNEDNVTPRYKKGKGWRMSAIRDILINPSYKGTQFVHRYIHVSKLTDQKPKDAILINIPAIVDNATWYTAQDYRKNNKHQETKSYETRLLQGLVKCGVCGHYFRSQSSCGHNTYECRGRLKYAHLDGSPRCTTPIIKADWLEEQVWERIEAIINDPNKLEPILRDTIKKLSSRERELNTRLRPIDTQLREVEEKKARLMDDFVMLNMNQEKYKDLQKSLKHQEARLRSMKTDIDPAQIEELKRTEGLLRFWQSQLDAMEWNLEDESGQTVKIADKPHRNVLSIIEIDNQDIGKLMNFPAKRRELLDLLQVKVIVFHDRIEINAIFPIEPIKQQLCSSIRGVVATAPLLGTYALYVAQ